MRSSEQGQAMQSHIFLIFLATTAVVVLSPGAAAIAIASQGAANGGRRAVAGVLGVAVANAGYFVLSATGVASLLIASHLVFAIIKWTGVIYLIWLGTSALVHRAGAIHVQNSGVRSSPATLFAKGFIVEAANPKALLYFSAIVPQFLDPAAPILPQFVTMGATAFALDLFGYCLYAGLGAYMARGGLKASFVNAINRLAGAALLLMAYRMSLIGARA